MYAYDLRRLKYGYAPTAVRARKIVMKQNNAIPKETSAPSPQQKQKNAKNRKFDRNYCAIGMHAEISIAESFLCLFLSCPTRAHLRASVPGRLIYDESLLPPLEDARNRLARARTRLTLSFTITGIARNCSLSWFASVFHYITPARQPDRILVRDSSSCAALALASFNHTFDDRGERRERNYNTRALLTRNCRRRRIKRGGGFFFLLCNGCGEKREESRSN